MASHTNDGALLPMRVIHELVHADHDTVAAGQIPEGIYLLVPEGADALTVVRSRATDPLADPVHLITYADPPDTGARFLADHGWRLDDLWPDNDDQAVQLLVDDPVQVLEDVARWRRSR